MQGLVIFFRGVPDERLRPEYCCVKYEKVHLNYNEQLQRIAKRGMPYDNQPLAIAALKQIGYYRFSGYTYAFRQFELDSSGVPTGGRLDEFQDGSRFEDALDLYKFDQKLRRCISAGLEDVEVGFRTRMAYALGQVDPMGHLVEGLLHKERCSRKVEGGTAYDLFARKFQGQRDEAKNHEFVKHFIMKYNGEIPIWAACEFMSFGLMVRLYDLLPDKQADAIARDLAAGDRSQTHLYLLALNSLRNACAHHSRVWNRPTIYPPRNPPKRWAHERIHHMAAGDDKRLYPLAVLTAHFGIQMNPSTNWPRQFKGVMKDFPAPLGMSPEKQVGFTEGWAAEEIWDYQPLKTSAATRR